MEWSRSWDADSSSGSYWNARMLWKPEVLSCSPKTPAHVRVPSHIHAFPSCFFNIYLYVTPLRPKSPKRVSFIQVSHQSRWCVVFSPYLPCFLFVTRLACECMWRVGEGLWSVDRLWTSVLCDWGTYVLLLNHQVPVETINPLKETCTPCADWLYVVTFSPPPPWSNPLK